MQKTFNRFENSILKSTSHTLYVYVYVLSILECTFTFFVFQKIHY